MKRLLLIVFAGLTVLCGVAAVMLLRAPASASPSVGWRFKFPAGKEWVYDVAWHGEQSAKVMQDQGAEGSADVDAELTLLGYGQTDGVWRVGARLGGFRKHSLKLLGQDAMGDDAKVHAAFDGHEALLEIEPTGRVRAVLLQPEDPPLFKHVMQWLATQLQVTIADEKSWTAEEAGPFGLSNVSYAVGPGGLERTRLAYTRLDAAPSPHARHTVDGKTRIELAPAGQLQSIALDESVAAEGVRARLHLDARLRATMDVELRAPVAGTERREPGQMVVSADLDQRLQEQRIDGLTIEQVIEDLGRFGEIGDSPEMNKWVWRTSGLLELHPELAQKLVAPFAKAGRNGRGLILDVLAQAGNAECQSVMRKLLDDKQAQKSPGYVEHLQRLSMLGKPEKETVEFAWKSYSGAPNADVKWASAYAFGSTVRHLAEENPDLARRYDRQLRDDAARAGTGEEQAMMIRALGNAAMADDVPMILDASGSEDADVRRASASALRLSDGDDAMQALLKLAADKEVSVQAAALASLDRHDLSANDLARLSQVVLAGGLNDLVEGMLVNLLSTRLGAGGAVVQMLQYVQGRTTDPRLRARIGQMLG